jgi:hypothetical protein
MIGRRRDVQPDSPTAHDRPLIARGGVSVGAILTGVVVAFGAMFVLTALIAGALTALGLGEDLTPGQQTEVGVATGIGLVVAQFLSYVWGGYAAGRMSRGAGAANGALVAVVAVAIGIAVGAIAAGIGATEDLRTPFNSSQLPADGEILQWGAGLAAAALAAMFLGAIAGGSMGSRWHTKLERAALTERTEPAGRTERPDAAHEDIDLRDERRSDARDPSGITTRTRRE